VSEKLYLILFLFIFSSCSFIAGAKTECKTSEDVALAGKVTIQKFENNVSGDPEPGEPAYISYYVLNLDKPINVLADKIGGPEQDVKQIQIAPSNAKLVAAVKQRIDKNVVIKGELFYQNTVYHHTKVLIFCNEINDK
jgi:hypothetical protein